MFIYKHLCNGEVLW